MQPSIIISTQPHITIDINTAIHYYIYTATHHDRHHCSHSLLHLHSQTARWISMQPFIITSTQPHSTIDINAAIHYYIYICTCICHWHLSIVYIADLYVPLACIHHYMHITDPYTYAHIYICIYIHIYMYHLSCHCFICSSSRAQIHLWFM